MSELRDRIAWELYAQECESWGVSTVEGYATPHQRSAYERRADRILALLEDEPAEAEGEQCFAVTRILGEAIGYFVAIGTCDLQTPAHAAKFDEYRDRILARLRTQEAEPVGEHIDLVALVESDVSRALDRLDDAAKELRECLEGAAQTERRLRRDNVVRNDSRDSGQGLSRGTPHGDSPGDFVAPPVEPIGQPQRGESEHGD